MKQQNDSCIHIDDLHDFVNKKLSLEENKIVTKHLETCQMCSSDVEDIRFIKDEYPDMDTKSHVQPIVAEELNELIEKALKKPKIIPLKKDWLAVASICIVLIASFLFYRLEGLSPSSENNLSNTDIQEKEEKQQENITKKNSTTAYKYDSNTTSTNITGLKESEEIPLNYNFGHVNNVKKNQIAKKEITEAKKTPYKIEKEETKEESLLAEVKIRHFKRTDYAFAQQKERRNTRGNILKRRKQNNLNELAKELFIAEKFKYAVDTFRYETAKQPDNWRPNFYLAFAYFGNKQYNEAIQSFENILIEGKIKRSEEGKLALVYYQLAKIYLEIGEREKAEKLIPKLHRYTERFKEVLNQASSK